VPETLTGRDAHTNAVAYLRAGMRCCPPISELESLEAELRKTDAITRVGERTALPKRSERRVHRGNAVRLATKGPLLS
jgi:hypothetical protein